MYAQPISERKAPVKHTDRTVALAEGWSSAEINWEAKSEVANLALDAGAPSIKVYKNILAAHFFARHFRKDDLRKLTSKANMAWLYDQMGWHRYARRRYGQIAQEWQAAIKFDDAEIKPRARSSLFHLRMEAKHWKVYREQRISRLEKFASESREALAGFANGEPSKHGLYARWRGEKIPIFDDHRRILSACLLILPFEK